MKFQGMLGNWSCGKNDRDARGYREPLLPCAHAMDQVLGLFCVSKASAAQFRLGVVREPLEWPSASSLWRSFRASLTSYRSLSRKSSCRKSTSRSRIPTSSRASQVQATEMEPEAVNRAGEPRPQPSRCRKPPRQPPPVGMRCAPSLPRRRRPWTRRHFQLRTAATHRRRILACRRGGKDLPGRHPGACSLRPRGARAASRNGGLRDVAVLFRLARIEAGGSAHFLPSRRFWRDATRRCRC